MTKVIKVPESHLEVISSPKQESQPTALSQLKYAEPTELYLRDGEVVIHRRPGSPLWHCRFRLQDGSWHRQTTRQASIEHAVRMACDLYDETRFRQRLGLAQKSPTFAEIAHATLYSMRQDLDVGIGKSVYGSYITCIEKYFLPYFGDKRLEEITYTDVHEFEVWRNRQMNKVPRASMLLYTGMRHGTEALNICWNNVEWHTQGDKKYLRIWVDGKTGGRWLIAKHKAVDVLKRLHSRQRAVWDIPFDRLFETRCPERIFVFANGHQPMRIDGAFKRLMRDSGLGLSHDGQMRTLYSLRHTYATLELLENKTDIHTLSKQMGNSAAMIDRHYSKLTATMAADRLA